MDCFLGIDLGSSSVKVSILDGDTGNVIAKGMAPETEAPILSVRNGWAEQNPEDWWAYLKTALRQAMASSNVKAEDVKAVGITYQMHGLVLVDKDLRVLRPSIIWCDSRAVPYGEKAFEDLGRVEIEEKAPLEHSDDDGAAFDFDKEAEVKIAPKDAVQEIDYAEVSDNGNNFTEEYTFFADGVLMKDSDETVAEINHILQVSFKNKDLYAIFEKNGYDDYCLRDTTTDTDYVISWSDESYKEQYGE